MSSVILTGDTSGTLTVSAPLVAGSNTVTLPAATGTISLLTQATSVSASGTSVDFTSIPSWAKRITVMLSAVSTSGTSSLQIQLGDSGGVENTGYVSSAQTSGTANGLTSGFSIGYTGFTAASTSSGVFIISSLGSNTWLEFGNLTNSVTSTVSASAGTKTLSDVLTQVRITTVSGTDTFDAGTINIMYEG